MPNLKLTRSAATDKLEILRGSATDKLDLVQAKSDGSPCCCGGGPTCTLACFPTPGEKVLILDGHATGSARDVALDSEDVDITSSFQLSPSIGAPPGDGTWPAGSGVVGSQYRNVPWRDETANPQQIKLTAHSAAAYVALTCTLKAKYLSKTYSSTNSVNAFRPDSDYYSGGRWPDFDRFTTLVFGGWSAPAPVVITDHENPVVTFAAASRTGPAISMTLTYNRATTALGYTVTGSETSGRPVGGSVTGSTAWNVFPGFNTDSDGRKDISIPWETWSGSEWVAASAYDIQVYMQRYTVGVVEEYTDAEQDFPMSMTYDGHYGSLRSADTWTETGVSILSHATGTPPACERYWTAPANAGTNVRIDITPVDLNLFSVASTVDPLDVAAASVDTWTGTVKIPITLTYPGGEDALPTSITIDSTDYAPSYYIPPFQFALTWDTGYTDIIFAGEIAYFNITYDGSSISWGAQYPFVSGAGFYAGLRVDAGSFPIPMPGSGTGHLTITFKLDWYYNYNTNDFVGSITGVEYVADSADFDYSRGAPNPINVTMSKLTGPYRWEATAIDELPPGMWDFEYSVDTPFDPPTVGSSSLVTASLTVHEDAPLAPALATATLNHSFQRLGAIESDMAWTGLHPNGYNVDFGPTRVVQSSSPIVCGAFLPKASYMGEEWDSFSQLFVELIDTGAGGSYYTERPGTRTSTVDVAAQTFSIHFVARCQTATTYDLTFNLSGTFNAGVIQSQTVDLSGAEMGAVGTHTVTLRAWVIGYQYGERLNLPVKTGIIPGDDGNGHSWESTNTVAAIIAYTGISPLYRSGIPYTEVLPVFVDAAGGRHEAAYAFTVLALKVSRGVTSCGFGGIFFGIPYQPLYWTAGFAAGGAGFEITQGICVNGMYGSLASASQYFDIDGDGGNIGCNDAGSVVTDYIDYTPYKAGFDPDWNRLREPITVIWRDAGAGAGASSVNAASAVTFSEA